MSLAPKIASLRSLYGKDHCGENIRREKRRRQGDKEKEGDQKYQRGRPGILGELRLCPIAGDRKSKKCYHRNSVMMDHCPLGGDEGGGRWQVEGGGTLFDQQR